MQQINHPFKKLLTPNQADDVPSDGVDVSSNVKVKAPAQADGKSVSYTVGTHEDLGALPDPDNFKPGRYVFNITLDKTSPIDPPVELNIEITADDVRRASYQKARSSFQLAYHNGRKWVPMGQPFAFQPGTVTVPLSKVGDPGIALSP